MQQHQAPQSVPPDPRDSDAARLAELESADTTLTPILAEIVSRFTRSEPLPPR